MVIKMITLILLATLNACKIPEYRIMDRCVYSLEFNICACQQYDLNSFKPLTDMQEVEMVRCDDLIGFNVKEWTEEITPKGKEIYNWVNDNCNPNRTE
jgi:hypothetical protein